MKPPEADRLKVPFVGSLTSAAVMVPPPMHAKVFYVTAVLTLAIGMAGAMVMFTLIRGILLRPLPVPEEDRLVVLWRVPPTGVATHIPYRASDIESLARESQTFAGVIGDCTR